MYNAMLTTITEVSMYNGITDLTLFRVTHWCLK